MDSLTIAINTIVFACFSTLFLIWERALKYGSFGTAVLNLKPESLECTFSLMITFSWQLKMGFCETLYFTNDSIGLLDTLIEAGIESEKILPSPKNDCLQGHNHY